MLGFGDHQLSYRNSPLDTHEVRLDVEEIIVHPGYRLWVQRNILQAHPSISHSRLSVSPGFLFRRRPRLLFKSLLQLGLAENDIALLKVMHNVTCNDNDDDDDDDDDDPGVLPRVAGVCAQGYLARVSGKRGRGLLHGSLGQRGDHHR